MTFLIKIQLLNWQQNVYQSTSCPQNWASVFTSHTNKLQSQVAITFEKHKLAEECIKVLQIEHINYRPVTGGRCIEAKTKATPLRGQGHDLGSSSSRTVLEDHIPVAYSCGTFAYSYGKLWTSNGMHRAVFVKLKRGGVEFWIPGYKCPQWPQLHIWTLAVGELTIKVDPPKLFMDIIWELGLRRSTVIHFKQWVEPQTPGKYSPVYVWIMQTCLNIFIHRQHGRKNWNENENTISNLTNLIRKKSEVSQD